MGVAIGRPLPPPAVYHRRFGASEGVNDRLVARTRPRSRSRASTFAGDQSPAATETVASGPVESGQLSTEASTRNVAATIDSTARSAVARCFVAVARDGSASRQPVAVATMTAAAMT